MKRHGFFLITKADCWTLVLTLDSSPVVAMDVEEYGEAIRGGGRWEDMGDSLAAPREHRFFLITKAKSWTLVLMKRGVPVLVTDYCDYGEAIEGGVRWENMAGSADSAAAPRVALTRRPTHPEEATHGGFDPYLSAPAA